MRISLEWLRDYVDFSDSAETLADRLTMTSLESVTILEKSKFLESVVVGKVNSVEAHPDADKLQVCQVDIGQDEDSQIICGAPNVAAGQKVPVILPGTQMPNGERIGAVKLRGVKSNGMIASERELTLSDSHAGIMVLRDEAKVGESFWNYLEKYWVGLDVEITPNRPDCMSHIGVAREVAVMNKTDLRKPDMQISESDESVEELAKVIIHDAQRCPRYAARVVKNVKIAPSPRWLQQRLTAVGLRPINNVVDLSNYVLMETGHPLHTFDYDKLAQNTIEVRTAEDGEEFTTLDGKKRELNSETLLICDAEQPVAIAGIMGGENSEVTDDTVNILIESAYFDPITIRRGSKYLGLSTEASKRFERGADPNGVLYALNRLTQLIQEIADGEVTAGILDEYPKPIEKKVVTIRQSKTEKLLGITISQSEIAGILESLEFATEAIDKDTLQVTVPTFRPDIEREVDLIEEVLRIYGMENVPSPGTFKYTSQVVVPKDDALEQRFIHLWKGYGFNRTFSNSLVNKTTCYPEATGKSPVRLKNPLSEEMAYLRTTLLPALLDGIGKNIKRKEPDVRLFELGHVFSANKKTETNTEEFRHFAAVASGNEGPVSWVAQEKQIDFYGFKGYIEATIEVLGLTGLSFKPLASTLFQPGFQLMRGKQVIGFGGKISGEIQDRYDISQPVFGVELNLDALKTEYSPEIYYTKPSEYPPVDRDLSFVVPQDFHSSRLTELLRESAGEMLQSITLYDVYEGQPIPEQHKSLTYALRFISPERTLTEREIDTIISRMVQQAQKNFGATLREE